MKLLLLLRRRKSNAVFMAFGTKGDVYPIAAIAAAFASDQPQYNVSLITHSAHQNLIPHLSAKNVSFFHISTPPLLSAPQDHHISDSFFIRKKMIAKEHRKECLIAMERIFGDDSVVEDDFLLINFFALEGWSLAELFRVRCVVAAPYVVPYSAPSSFERQFKKTMPHLYMYLQGASTNRVCWKDVTHWMWPLFSEDWGSWRSYWPSNVKICGFWSVPMEWQFSCNKCRELSFLFSRRHLDLKDKLCSTHSSLQQFLMNSTSHPPIFLSFSSVGSMGLLRNSRTFLRVLESVMKITSHRLVLFTAGYEPLDSAIRTLAGELSCSDQRIYSEDGVLLWNRLYCFSGTIPYNWLFQRCAAAVHHGGSGSTAAALQAGIPQIICPFLLDQFYWAERMFWLGVAPEPLQKNLLFLDKDDEACIRKAANVLSNAINSALSPEIKSRASAIAERLHLEDGVGEAVGALKQEIYGQS
ncbi:hypothetical protein ACHQM5_016644 [Ranunculus cassubicifolius]